jgi:hypothetical protein
MKGKIKKSALLCKDMTFGWSLLVARISHINMASHHFIFSSQLFLTQVRSGLKFSPFLGLLVSFTHALAFGGQVLDISC